MGTSTQRVPGRAVIHTSRVAQSQYLQSDFPGYYRYDLMCTYFVLCTFEYESILTLLVSIPSNQGLRSTSPQSQSSD